MATGINLAPGTQYIVELRERRQRLFMAAAIIGAAIIVAWVALYLFQRQLVGREGSVNERIRGVESEIAKLDTDAQRIILFEERLNDLDGLLNAHISWNPFLADLERLLPPGTVLSALDIDNAKSSATMTGITPDVDQVAVTLASLTNTPERKTAFQKASVIAVNRREVKGADGAVASVQYEFTAELSFDPNMLYVNK